MNTDPSQTTPWWRHAVIYQVYPRSFADANGDGIGDLPGIISRLDHLVELGVDAVWLSPFYRSPQADAGYDVADYRGVDPCFGTDSDAQTLIDAVHERGQRIIVDLVPNHTSSAHPWFQAALAAPPGSPQRQMYLFRDGRGVDGSEPPNNWTSVFGGPAWTRVDDGQWYLHLFDASQPDLNWANPLVRAEFHDILRFWLDRGVDGFRVDVANALVKADGLPDWYPPESGGERVVAADLVSGPMWDQEGVHEIFRGWRAILDQYSGERVLVAEAWVSPIERLARYLRPDEMHQAFNFVYLRTPWLAGEQRAAIVESLAAAEAVGAPTTWVLSNHDVIRHATRLGYPPEQVLPNGLGPDDVPPDRALGLRRARAAMMLILALPGVVYLYQGEELGLPEDVTLPDAARVDPTWVRSGGTVRGRDGCRVPLPWVAEHPSYGFGPGGASWLPQPAIWAQYALDRQRGVPGSTYECYRDALRIRRERGLGTGTVEWVDLGPDVVALRNGAVLVVTNMGDVEVALPQPMRVLLASQVDGDHEVVRAVAPDVTVWVVDA